MTKIHIPLALKHISLGGKKYGCLGLVALGTLLVLMPNGSTYKISALPVVFAIFAAPVAARGPMIGSAVRKSITRLVIVVVVPLPAPVEVVAPTTNCPTTFDC